MFVCWILVIFKVIFKIKLISLFDKIIENNLENTF